MMTIKDVKNIMISDEGLELYEEQDIDCKLDEDEIEEFFNNNELIIEIYKDEMINSKELDVEDYDFTKFIVLIGMSYNLKLKSFENYDIEHVISNILDENSEIIYILSEENIKYFLDNKFISLSHEPFENIWRKGEIDLIPYMDKLLKSIDRAINEIRKINIDFLLYVLNYINREKIYLLLQYYTKENAFLDKLLQMNFKLKNENEELFLKLCFNNKLDIELLEILRDKFDYKLTGDLLDDEYANTHKNFDRVKIERLEFLSTFENFDDFVNNNLYVLINICDKECFEFLRNRF